MQQLNMNHLHKDLLSLKRDVAVIKHILSEEGELTEEAKRLLGQARKTPREKYVKLRDLK